LLNFFRRRKLQSELDAQLEHHLALLEQEHRQHGLSIDEARLAARRDFGGIVRTKETCWEQVGIRLADTLWQDICFAIRSFIRTPRVTAAVVLTLMAGIGVNVAMFSVINTVLITPLPYRDPDRLVWITESSKVINSERVLITDIVDWQAHARSFDTIAAFSPEDATLTADGESVRIRIAWTSTNLNGIFGVSPAVGRDFLPEELIPGGRGVLLLSDHFFRARFRGDSAILGKTVFIANRPYTVVGVLPPSFRLPLSGRTGIQSEPEAILNSPLDVSERFVSLVLGRLKPNVDLNASRVELEAISRASKKGNIAHTDRELHVVSLHESIIAGSRLQLFFLWAAVGFVLLIACANVTNLLLARSAARSREMAIRTALGAGRVRIIRQLLTESVLLSFAGASGGLLVGWFGIHLLIQQTAVQIPRLKDAVLDADVLLFSLMVCTFTGIVSGMTPALRSSRISTNDTLRNEAKTASMGQRGLGLNAALVVCEIALALMLVMSAALMLKSLWLMNSAAAQFSLDHVLSSRLELHNPTLGRYGEKRQFLQSFLSQVESVSGVSAAATSIYAAGGGMELVGMPTAGVPEDVRTELVYVTPRYFETTGMHLMAGRLINDQDDERAPRVVLVNEAFVRYNGLSDNTSIIGRELRAAGARDRAVTDQHRSIVIGVVSDFRTRPDADVGPQTFFSLWQNPITTSTRLYVRTLGAPLSIANAISKIVNRTPQVNLVAIQTLEDEMSGAVAPRHFQAQLLGVLAALAILLAAIGTHGVLSYAVTKRTREIGIRVALGACTGDVVRLILSGAAKLVVCGLVLGVAGSVMIARLISGLLYGVEPTDPWIYATVLCVLIAVAFAAAYLPARRALRIHPVDALRFE